MMLLSNKFFYRFFLLFSLTLLYSLLYKCIVVSNFNLPYFRNIIHIQFFSCLTIIFLGRGDFVLKVFMSHKPAVICFFRESLLKRIVDPVTGFKQY